MMSPIRLMRRPPFGIALVAVALLALPWIAGAFGESWVRILDFSLIYIMLALGLNIVVGYAGLLDLGYIGFYAVGAYVYALLASPQFNLHWALWLTLPLGALVACIFGLLLGTPTLKLRGDYLAIVTLGFGEIIRIVLNNLDHPVNITNGPQGIGQLDTLRIGPWDLGNDAQLFHVSVPAVHQAYYLFVGLAIIIIVICLRLQHSRIGRAWAALREDEIAAAAMGINIRNVKLLAFAMGASIAGVAGGLFSGFQNYVSPDNFQLTESIMVLSMVVLGGMGHIPGVIVGALLLYITPEVLRRIAEPIQNRLWGHTVVDPANLRMLLFGLALVLVMRWRPEGLWPSSQRRRELHANDPETVQEDGSPTDAEQRHV